MAFANHFRTMALFCWLIYLLNLRNKPWISYRCEQWFNLNELQPNILCSSNWNWIHSNDDFKLLASQLHTRHLNCGYSTLIIVWNIIIVNYVILTCVNQFIEYFCSNHPTKLLWLPTDSIRTVAFEMITNIMHVNERCHFRNIMRPISYFMAITKIFWLVWRINEDIREYFIEKIQFSSNFSSQFILQIDMYGLFSNVSRKISSTEFFHRGYGFCRFLTNRRESLIM